MATFTPGVPVRARNREWVVLPESTHHFLGLRPLGGTEDDQTGVFPALERVEPASFPPPTLADLGDHSSARMLRDALRIGFRSSAGPFRSLARLAVEPRSYQPPTSLLHAACAGFRKELATLRPGSTATALTREKWLQRT